MTTTPEPAGKAEPLRCPTCRALLKKRRARKADDCELVCGGCGEAFDGCDLETVDQLRKQTP